MPLGVLSFPGPSTVPLPPAPALPRERAREGRRGPAPTRAGPDASGASFEGEGKGAEKGGRNDLPDTPSLGLRGPKSWRSTPSRPVGDDEFPFGFHADKRGEAVRQR